VRYCAINAAILPLHHRFTLPSPLFFYSSGKKKKREGREGRDGKKKRKYGRWRIKHSDDMQIELRADRDP